MLFGATSFIWCHGGSLCFLLVLSDGGGGAQKAYHKVKLKGVLSGRREGGVGMPF